jgi:hypothetical protein
MGTADPNKSKSPDEPMQAVLSTFRKREETGFGQAWVGMEPTFSTKKAVRRWAVLSETAAGEEQYFRDPYMLRMEKKVGQAIADKYRTRRKKEDDACMFRRVELEQDVDQWGVQRQNLIFRWKSRELEPFEVRFGLDPETFEYSIKPVPLAWLYDERFVRFLQKFVWDVPTKLGLRASIAHGGGQFSVSAKTFMTGSLLADEIASRLNHPELANWIMDYPNPDERSFRATRARRAAFAGVLEAYWAGGYHPVALGGLRVQNAYLDRGFGPAASPPAGLMDAQRGPMGSPQEVFQTNFAFGRSVRWQAQDVHPGYWQGMSRDEDGYRPEQIMRYSEGNLNRLQIAGERHVKSDKVLDPKEVPEFDAPLDISMLYDESSWEYRSQMSRTSARDFVEAVLLEMHFAQVLQAHPHVRTQPSLLQDQLMGEADETLERTAPKVLEKLRRQARKENLESSEGRFKTDWVEPEALFWAAWRHLPAGEKAAIAREAVTAFVQRVHQAAEKDPRPGAAADPMEPHRHRVHPLLWKALEAAPGMIDGDATLRAEWEAWQSKRKEYLGRRPIWSVTGAKPPWK